MGETKWVVAVCMVGDPRRGMVKEGLGLHSRQRYIMGHRKKACSPTFGDHWSPNRWRNSLFLAQIIGSMLLSVPFAVGESPRGLGERLLSPLSDPPFRRILNRLWGLEHVRTKWPWEWVRLDVCCWPCVLERSCPYDLVINEGAHCGFVSYTF